MAFGFKNELLKHGQNEAAPRGVLQGAIASVIRGYQHSGRTLFHWWDGFGSTGTQVYRYLRPNFLEGGGNHQRAYVHLTSTGLTPPADSGFYLDGYLNSYPPDFNTDYPDNIVTLPDNTDNDDDNVTGDVEDSTVGSSGLYAPSGCVYEDAIKEPTPSETLDPSKFASGRDILATQAGSYGTMNQMRDRFDHTWKNRRPVFNWCTNSTTSSFIGFSTSSQAYRYIFDQSIGTGGTAPSLTNKAITLPGYAAGIYNFNILRVYVSVYASMSGGTDTGSIGVANRAVGGAMQAFQAMQNPVTISGTTYAWYPGAGAFDPSTHMYFDTPTAEDFDRVCIGARSSGASDYVRVRAVALFVCPSLL